MFYEEDYGHPSMVLTCGDCGCEWRSAEGDDCPRCGGFNVSYDSSEAADLNERQR